MEIKSKIFKRKAGKSKEKWILRIEYYDETFGKWRCIERSFDKKGDATDEESTQIDNLKKSHGQIQTGDKMTFNDLVMICEKHFYKPAVVIEGRKVAGLRSYDKTKPHLNPLKQFFGNRLLRQITTESLTDYKLWRLKTVSERTNRNIKIASVNRELAALRKMMRFAYGKGWVLKDIFFNAKVIDMSAEVERHRILTLEEEERLLNSCKGIFERTYKRHWKGKDQEITAKVEIDNLHLKVMMMISLDSALRQGEILKLRWRDFDLENNVIRIVGTHTKTERERLVPLSQRVKDELGKLRSITKGDKPFPFQSIKHSFGTVKDIAKIKDLRFHDLRRTAITRWQQHSVPLALAGKLAGHAQLQTTMKHYTAADIVMVKEVAEKMNAFYSQLSNKVEIESELVS